MTDFPALENLPPLKFTPIYQEQSWGGEQLAALPARAVPAHQKIGEAWDLVDRPERQVAVQSGELSGVTLHELVRHYGTNLLGSRGIHFSRFPLIVKLIDAQSDLGLQVHPDKAACSRIGAGAEPQSKMWYLMRTLPDAQIIAGLNRRATRQGLIEKLNTPELVDFLQTFKSEAGDAYFIPAGMIHALSGGNLLLEISQNSATTYRLSNQKTSEVSGQLPPLEVENAILATNFFNRRSPRIAGVQGKVAHNRKFEVVTMCPAFQIDELHIRETWCDDTVPTHSFHLLTAVNAPFSARQSGTGRSARADVGETLLLPAVFGGYEIVPETAAETIVIKTRL